MNLYLIRHGESMGNKLGKIQGTEDFPLSPLGEKQAAELGSYFKAIPLDYIYSSDLTRAHETAKAIGQVKGLPVEATALAREVHLGPFQGKTRAEIYEHYPETKKTTILTSGIEGTETVEELTKRCNHFRSELLMKHRGENVAIVSHGGFISIFLMYLVVGKQWYNFHRPFRIDNTNITRVEWTEDDRFFIHYIGRNNHLETLSNKSNTLL
ncbi:histidine phosphatase family protein [Halalkalibacterium halodurans]|uniref:histidine phosphatase family protein n=1 Tax=Halalkalibacterium halodurans TaxID=86665 RepID=UPI002E1F4695|nr:histidine phosphatase family protein [Halalkalibacterium halodurans]